MNLSASSKADAKTIRVARGGQIDMPNKKDIDEIFPAVKRTRKARDASELFYTTMAVEYRQEEAFRLWLSFARTPKHIEKMLEEMHEVSGTDIFTALRPFLRIAFDRLDEMKAPTYDARTFTV